MVNIVRAVIFFSILFHFGEMHCVVIDQSDHFFVDLLDCCEVAHVIVDKIEVVLSGCFDLSASAFGFFLRHKVGKFDPRHQIGRIMPIFILQRKPEQFRVIQRNVSVNLSYLFDTESGRVQDQFLAEDLSLFLDPAVKDLLRVVKLFIAVIFQLRGIAQLRAALGVTFRVPCLSGVSGISLVSGDAGFYVSACQA